MLIVKRVARGAAVMFAVVAIAGCVRVSDASPVELSVVGGKLALAFCMNQNLRALEVTQRQSGASPEDERVIWSGSGSVDLAVGDVIVLGDDVDGMSTTSLGEDVYTGAGSTIFISARYGESGSYDPSIVVGDSGLVEGEWLASSGARFDEPCASSAR